MTRPFTTLLICAFLASCGTPQERCINGVTRDLRILDRLIGETELNLKRGYAMEEVVLSGLRWEICAPAVAATATTAAQPERMCLEDYDYTQSRPKAINLADEREKLVGMQAKRKSLAMAAAPGVAQCKRLHPE